MSSHPTVIYRKLVRDKIPDLIFTAGERPQWKRLDNDAEYITALLAKAVEEATELQLATEEQRINELADLTEVLYALLAALGISQEQVIAVAEQKRAQRGGFTERIWLEQVEH